MDNKIKEDIFLLRKKGHLKVPTCRLQAEIRWRRSKPLRLET